MSLLFFPTSVTFLCHNLLPNSTAVGYVVEEKKSSITSGCRRFSGTMCSPRPFQLVWQNCCPDLAISLRRKQDKKKPDLRNRARNWSEWKSCDATFLIIRFFSFLFHGLQFSWSAAVTSFSASQPPHLLQHGPPFLQHGPHDLMKRNPCKILSFWKAEASKACDSSHVSTWPAARPSRTRLTWSSRPPLMESIRSGKWHSLLHAWQ